MSSAIAKLRNPIHNYAWGSRHFIAGLQGRPTPSAEPEAEMWIGAHSRGPSVLADDPSTSLIELIAKDPDGALGKKSVERFGPTLPFLVKILAAAEPLSIQVHPDTEQARAGFDAENAAGIPLDALERSYSDPYRKIELLIALEPTDALCGFRAIDSALPLLERIGGRVTKSLVALGRKHTATFSSDLFHALRGLAGHDRSQLIAEVTAFAEREQSALPEAAWICKLSRAHAKDPSILAPLLLNLVSLAPSEALFIAPRTVHAYLKGSGIEVMSSSDNVLRGGLTPKFVNEGEFKKIAAAEPREPAVVRGRAESARSNPYAPKGHSIPEFSVCAHQFDSRDPEKRNQEEGGPQILVCVEGTFAVESQIFHGESERSMCLELQPGDTAWVSDAHAPGSLSLDLAPGSDRGTIYSITTG